MTTLPLGKLPLDQLQRLLDQITPGDPRLLAGPGIGIDCAVIDLGHDMCLVAKTDPITFATDQIGWYSVQVNANDIATTGAAPRWFLATLLLPEAHTDATLIESLLAQMRDACAEVGAWLVGGHTEVTYGIDRPIVAGAMLGEVARDKLILPQGARVGDALLLTKRVAVEGTSIIAREKAAELADRVDAALLARAQGFLHTPGISVVRDAQIATASGRVHAMHDPTEGGLATALHELATAAAVGLEIDARAVPFYDETKVMCAVYDLDAWGLIASGSMLLAVHVDDATHIAGALRAAGIEATVIGRVVEREHGVRLRDAGGLRPLPTFARDEITRLFET
jgi:hydrogenase maturation factor